MSRILKHRDITEILYGAAFLSTGGGGPLSTGLSMLADLADRRDIALELVSPADMAPDAYAVTAIGYGSPDAFDGAAFGQEAVHAFDAYTTLLAASGKAVSYICTLEYAGFNTFTPMLVAMEKGLPLLDIDLNGKAVMELNASLGRLSGQRIYPIVLADRHNNITVIDAGDKRDIPYGERIMLEIAKLSDMRLGVANNLLSFEEVQDKTVHGAITLAQRVGQAVLAHRETGAPLMPALTAVIPAVEICSGALTDKRMLDQGKFNTGTLAVDDPARGEFMVDFRNEALMVRRGADILLTAPDLICIFDAENRCPITCSEVKPGMALTVVGAPASEKWWACPGGQDMYGQYLRLFAADAKAVRLQTP